MRTPISCNWDCKLVRRLISHHLAIVHSPATVTKLPSKLSLSLLCETAPALLTVPKHGKKIQHFQCLPISSKCSQVSYFAARPSVRTSHAKCCLFWSHGRIMMFIKRDCVNCVREGDSATYRQLISRICPLSLQVQKSILARRTVS